MKKHINLKKLAKLKVIELVDPSENLYASYFQKSTETLQAARILLKNNLLSDAVSLVYFSMYDSLLALFFKCGIKSENHNVSLFLLEKLFGISRHTIQEAKERRINQQYYPSLKLAHSEVEKAIKETENFRAQIYNFAEKLTNHNLTSYRTKFIELMKC